MKPFALIITICLAVFHLNAQTLIATSHNPEATANHNQRKIVRDSEENIYVVFTDVVNDENIIKGIHFDFPTKVWDSAFEICPGTNPSLAISELNVFYLVYETNDPVIPQIMEKHSVDFTNWTAGYMLSDSTSINYLPVADVDGASFLNVFWVRQNESYSQSLLHRSVSGDSVLERQVIATKNSIHDIAVAGHLQYFTNDLYFAMQYNQDSLLFYHSSDNLENLDVVYSASGTQPCISYNDAGQYGGDEFFCRFLYLNTDSQLREVENAGFNDTLWYSVEVPWGIIDFICIDDIAPPLGYSFLFMQNGSLYHGFSYGAWWNFKTILDTVSGATILNPALAYKHFNFENVDFIWMEENSGSTYDIYYKRDAKYIYPLGKKDYEEGKGFSIVVYPNPFAAETRIEVSVDKEGEIPVLEIYNTRSQLVKALDLQQQSDKLYLARWDGINSSGVQCPPGSYIFLATVGDKRTARKISLVR